MSDVTDDEVREAWDIYWQRPAEWSHIPIEPPKDYPDSRPILDALRRVLEHDRQRRLRNGNT